MKNPMNLPIFAKFDSLQGLYNGVRFISGTELELLENYNEYLDTHKKEKVRTCLLIHCNDMVIVTHHFRKLHQQLRDDLIANPTFEIILISVYDYHSICPLPLDLPNFTWIYFPEYHGIYWNIYQDTSPITKDEEFEYYFLSMNKRLDMYRQALCYKFYDSNWIDTSIFTYLGESKKHTKLFDVEGYYDIEKQIIEKNIYQNIPKTPNPIFVEKEEWLLKKYCEQRLIKKSISDDEYDVDPSWLINRDWYTKTYCSIILETDVDNAIVNLSEKTFRSIMMQHPLFLFASENTYDYMKSIGLTLLSENELWDKGTVFERFDIFLNYLDVLYDKIKNNPKVFIQETHNHSIILRNQYYDLYVRMTKKENSILNLILNKFSFLRLLV